MPWVPELFTAPVLQQILDKRRRDALVAVPYFDGLMAGDPDALVESFADEPEVHDPVRGRIKGVAAFRAFVTENNEWLRQHHASVEDVAHVVLDGRGFEEVVLHLDVGNRIVSLPVAIVADRRHDGRIEEVRVYFTSQPLTGRHVDRLPVLQPNPRLDLPDVVAELHRALTAGDVDAVVAAFEPDGYVREPAGGHHTHHAPDRLRAFYERMCSNDGNLLEVCALADDGRACAVEHNLLERGAVRVTPQAGVAVYVRGAGGRLAAARLYDDVDRSLVAGV